MTRKEKYNFLNQYVIAEKQIDNLIAEKIRWEYKRGAVGGMGGTGGGNSTFNTTSKVENVAIQICEIIADIEKQIETCKMARKSVFEIIEQEQNTRNRCLLEMRFLRGMTINQISIDLDKDYKTIVKCVNKSIDRLEMK